jgi:DNA-3-methyladenine glycosylase I
MIPFPEMSEGLFIKPRFYRTGSPVNRCEWADRSEMERSYHDNEWGEPVHDDRRLFEFLILEGAQAGLSWSTVLRKREDYRKAFDNFDARKISRYSGADFSRLMGDSGIIRNRLKIRAAVTNAAAFLRVQEEFGSFDRYIWRFVDGRTIQNSWKRITDIPSRSPESDAMSRDLRSRGFSFVGTTICYAFMQAVGMVNDHVAGCFRHRELEKKKEDRSAR